MKKFLATSILLSALALIPSFSFAHGSGSHFPKPFGYVNDYANIISDKDEEGLNNTIYELKKKTGAEIAVVTTKTLDGHPIEETARQLGLDWGIGDKDKNNGAVFLTAIDDQKTRIEVGYGLEGFINDAKAGRILDDYAIPYFKQKDYSQGIVFASTALINEIAKGYNVKLSGNTKITLPEKHQQNEQIPPIFPIMFFIFLIIITKGKILLFMPLGGYSNYGSGFGGGSNSFGGFGGGCSFGGGGSSRGW